MTSTTETPTHDYTLDNGLRVIVRQDHRLPNICASLFHKVGTDHERPHQQGLAYLTGGATYQDKNKEKAIGAINYGWLDYPLSAYSLDAPRHELTSVLDLLAARMAPPVLTQERLNKGIEHIQALELRDPYFSSDYWLNPAFKQLIFSHANTGYKFGNIDDLSRLTVADVLRWHAEGYGPNNTILVIAGDTSLEEIQPLVQHRFGDIAPAKVLASLAKPASLPQCEERRLIQHLDTELPRLQMAFNTPFLATPDTTNDVRALQVIAALLSKGPEAWLPGRLSEGKDTLTSAISILTSVGLQEDLFLISATLGEHTLLSVQELELEVMALLEALKHHALDADTLSYGHHQALENLKELDTLEIQVTLIGTLAVMGQPLALLDSEAEQIQSVTADDIQRVANKYFNSHALSVAHNVPRHP
ncbi:insulinase family protein [Pseudomonas sp. SIMBA_077]